MKFSLLILLLLNFTGNNVIGEQTKDDLPKLTQSKPLVSEEELESLNNLRTDILKSLNDLISKMGTDNGRNNAEEFKGKIIGDLKAGKSELSEKEDFGTIVENLDIIVDYSFPTFIPSYIAIVSDESDQSKWLEYNNTMVPEFKKRLEPLKKYED